MDSSYLTCNEYCTREITVLWNEPWTLVEFGLWSMLSTAAVVNRPPLSLGDQHTIISKLAANTVGNNCGQGKNSVIRKLCKDPWWTWRQADNFAKCLPSSVVRSLTLLPTSRVDKACSQNLAASSQKKHFSIECPGVQDEYRYFGRSWVWLPLEAQEILFSEYFNLECFSII